MKVTGQNTQNICLILIKSGIAHVTEWEKLVQLMGDFIQYEIWLVFLLLFYIFQCTLKHFYVLVSDNSHKIWLKIITYFSTNKFLLIIKLAILFVSIHQHFQMLFLSQKTHSFSPLFDYWTYWKQLQIYCVKVLSRICDLILRISSPRIYNTDSSNAN